MEIETLSGSTVSRRTFGVRDATSGTHKSYISGSDDLNASDTILVLNFSLKEVSKRT